MSATPITSPISLATDRAGRAMAQPMEATLLESLQQHLNMERATSASHFAMAIWCADCELRGFSQYCKYEG